MRLGTRNPRLRKFQCLLLTWALTEVALNRNNVALQASGSVQ